MTAAVALGLAVGLMLALTGAGGGIMAVPLLVFGLGLGVADAAPVALLAVGLAAALGAAIGLRGGCVRYRAAGFMALLGFAGAPLGWWLGRHIPNAPLTLLFAAVMVYTATRLYLRARRDITTALGPARNPHAPCAVNPADGRLRWTRRCAQALGAAGLTAGVLSTLLGVGGGFVIVPALLRVTDLDMKNITATSLAVIALISAGSVAVIWGAGRHLAWNPALPFAAGALLGLLGGRVLAQRLSGPRLQQGFALLSLAVAGLLAVRVTLGWPGTPGG